MRFRPTRFAVPGILAVALALASPCRAQDGILGIFFDREGRTCSGDIPTASFATLYVVLLAEGATYGGITGAEFRIDTSAAGGFLFQSEQGLGSLLLGSAFAGGANVAFPSCQSRSTVPVLSFQVYNSGAATTDAVLRTTAKSQPSNPSFACPLATQCDLPIYTTTCVEGAIARLNPSSPLPCGSSRVDSEWTRVKALFR